MSWTSCCRTTSSPDTTRISGGELLVMLTFCTQDVPRWPATLEKIMIVVSAATGEFGRLIVDQLRNRMPASDVTRDVHKAADLADRGAQLRYGDYQEPDSLRNS